MPSQCIYLIIPLPPLDSFPYPSGLFENPQQKAITKSRIMRLKLPKSKARKNIFSRAFTLIELLVVIAIIGILAGMLAVVYPKVLIYVKKSQTKGMLLDLTKAVDQYILEYNRPPIASGYDEMTDIVFDGSEEGKELLTVLIGEDGTEIRNKRELKFFDATESNGFNFGIVYDSSSIPIKLLDAWGQPISMRIDADADEKLDNPDTEGSTTIIRKTSIAWSKGAEAEEKEGNEWTNNVVSWKQ